METTISTWSQAYLDRAVTNTAEAIAKLEKTIANHKAYEQWLRRNIARAETQESIIKTALRKIGFEAHTITVSAAHYSDSIDYSTYERNISLDVRANQVGRRRPYEHSHRYMSRQEGKRREEGRRKSEADFEKASNGHTCRINQYSLDKVDNALVTVHLH